MNGHGVPPAGLIQVGEQAGRARAGQAAEPLLAVTGLVKRYGGLVVTQDVFLDVMPGEVHALLGPNGAGKTTLLCQVTGDVHPDAGSIHFHGRDITHLPVDRRALLGIGRSFQITSVFADLTVLENAALGVQAHAGHSFRFWRPVACDASLLAPAMALLRRVGLEEVAQRRASELSHGQHRQLEIALALAGDPPLLLLDEPMAGMGTEDCKRLLRMLQELKGSVAMLLVEHDMDAVFALADRITVLVYGERIATGTPAEIRANPAVRSAYLGEEATQ